ncbi:MAG: RNA methyltransferase [Spirochaetales bacterium]
MDDPTPYWGFSERQWTRSGLTLAEGNTLARRLLASSLVPEAVHCLEAHYAEFTVLAAGRCPVQVLSQAEMDRWAGFSFHRGVIAVAHRPAPLTLEAFLAGPARRLAVAPRLTDPENLGALYRSALALGWDAVAVGRESCDPFSRRCAKVSMGAVYAHPPVQLPDSLVAMQKLFGQAGWTTVVLALEEGALPLEVWRESPAGRTARAGKLAVWVGNEFEGLSPTERLQGSIPLVLPMAEGHDSLNASVAASVALYRLASAQE